MESTLLNILYEKTLGLSLLIGLVLLVRPLILRWSCARLAYQTWLVIPLYLVLPAGSAWTGSELGKMIFYANASAAIAPVSLPTPDIDHHSALWIGLIWLTGVLYFSIRYFRTCSKIQSSFQPINLDIAKYRDFKGSNLKLAHSTLIDFPAVFGLIKPTIILPKNFEQYSIDRQTIILQHELFHVSRRDYQINQFRHLLRIFFWFNPLVYLADKYLEVDQEMSCDQGVLERQSSIQAHDYASCLLQEVTTTPRALLLSQWNYPQLIKERIKMIGKNNSRFWHKYLIGLFAFFSVSYASLLLAHQQENEPTITQIVQPGYPKTAAMNKQEGEVRFAFDLKEDGSPTNIKIIASKPEGIFDEVALKAFRQWRFETKNTPHENLKYTMSFVLQ